MSRQHVNAYRTHLAKIHAVSGSLNEGVVSGAFGKLLESWGRSLDLTLVNQWEGKRAARQQHQGGLRARHERAAHPVRLLGTASTPR